MWGCVCGLGNVIVHPVPQEAVDSSEEDEEEEEQEDEKDEEKEEGGPQEEEEQPTSSEPAASEGIVVFRIYSAMMDMTLFRTRAFR